MSLFQSYKDNMSESTSDTKLEISEITEILDNPDIDDKFKNAIIRCIQYEGPLPPPEMLAQYDAISPGFAQEIIQMTKSEQLHRQDMERKIVENETSTNIVQLELVKYSISIKSRLQLFGVFITTLLVVLGFVCIFLNKNIGSITAFIFAIGSFCWTMFYGKREPTDRDFEKDEEG